MNVKRILLICLLGYLPVPALALAPVLTQIPLNQNQGATPLVMLTMERDHKLFYEAYNDHADINLDGGLDIRYKPGLPPTIPGIDYAGYFDPYKCYKYNTNVFTPVEKTTNKQCPNDGTAPWSGDYLNYLTMTRMDALRRVLYGGSRSTDTTTSTVLKRSYVPQDAHSWGKEYTSTAVDGFDISLYTPFAQPATGKRHLLANTTLVCPSGNTDTTACALADPDPSVSTIEPPLLRVIENSDRRVWEWLSIERPVAGIQCVTGKDSAGKEIRSNCIGTRTNYMVRVQACVANLLESECQGYPTNNPTYYKPVGLLQQYGEVGRMAFGLMTGSYAKNTSGGVLRKNMSSIADEIDPATGILTSTVGVIKSIDRMRIIGFGSGYSYDQNCGVPEIGGPLAENRCRMWGNPLAEIMYESLRYFAGKATPTTAYSGTDADATTLGLPTPTWKDPYKATDSGGGGYPVCSKPSQLVISDITPNFDTDQLPGQYLYTAPKALAGFATDMPSGLNVKTLADTIWASEYGADKTLFIGQSGSDFDGTPKAKTVTSFASMRGLAPEEPTQQGGYYEASVAMYGKQNDLNTAGDSLTCAAGDLFCTEKNQKTDTFSVALSSPLPRIEFPLQVSGTGSTKTFSHFIKLIPFGKTVGGCGTISITKGNYQPTNTIVDFYVDTMVNTNASNVVTDTASPDYHGGLPYAKFRINYEDSEYGSDHDMDAIAEYEMTVTATDTLTIRTSSIYAAGGCVQHMGFAINGTTADGTYLTIRDSDTASNSDVDYYLDTPQIPGGLPTDTTRTFTYGATSTAEFVAHDPLWYAAKWGGYLDSNKNNQLDTTEWDNRDGIQDGVPDNYFLVTNASKLKEQLERAFMEILGRQSSSSSAATNSTSLQTQSRVFQAKYNGLDWSGQLLSYKITYNISKNRYEIVTPEEWDTGLKIKNQDPNTGRVIITKGATDGVGFGYANLTGLSATVGSQKNLLDTNAAGTINDGCGPERVAYLRGDASHEAITGTFKCASNITTPNFRKRSTKLGDLINSNPLYVSPPRAGYLESEAPGYKAFRIANKNRKPVVYVGGNDGMLHGIDASITGVSVTDAGTPTADAGKEVLAYIPSQVHANLSKLTGQTYNLNHRYFIDASPMMADVDLGASAWRSVLIGAMAAGGKGYFALNITNPDTGFTESNASNILLWEFGDDVDADMGYAFNKAPIDSATGQAKQIVKMANGKWAAILGNGYNSAAGKAVLYIVYMKDGVLSASDFVKIEADAPSAKDNGLSTPVPFDTDGDGTVDTVYAGDLKGNLWKFDVNGNDVTKWAVANSNKPLFTAKSSTGAIQPIISPPEITLHPVSGQLIFFGTGKYIENADQTNTDTQTFYGIWDDVSLKTDPRSRADLLQQTLSTATCSSPPTAGTACTLKPASAGARRIPSSNAIKWCTSSGSNGNNCQSGSYLGWYIDLPASGERVVGIPQVINKIIAFNTVVPPSTLCDPGTGFFMALNYQSGGLITTFPVFDSDGSGAIDSSDVSTGGIEVGFGLGGSIVIGSSDKALGGGKAIVITSTNGGFGGGSSSGSGSDGSGSGVTTDTGGGDGSSSGGYTPPIFNPGDAEKGRQTWREM